MVSPLYEIRANDVHDRDPYAMYHIKSTLFSIKLNHGGLFTNAPDRTYKNGKTTFVDLIDSDQFSIHEIDSMLEDLEYDGRRVMFYHFLKPGCDLDNGLEPLACDKDIQLLGNYVIEGLKLVEVYVEHEKTNPDIYTPVKPKKLVIEELDDAPRTSKAGITPVAKKLVLDVNEGSGKDPSQFVNLEAGQSSAVDKDGSSQVPSQFANDFYSSYDPYVESQDPNVDPFADLELISPTNHEVEVQNETMNETEGNNETDVEIQTEGEEEDSDSDDDSDDDSEDSDYILDENNNVDEVDVDMRDFEYNIDETVEFMGCRESVPVDIEDDDPDGDDVHELENDYFESSSGSDSEGTRLRKRKLKQLRKQAHSSEKIYKTYFYVGRKFANKESVKEYIKEHSIETRRKIRFEKNDGERVRAVCRGVIPSLGVGEDNNLGSGPSQCSRPSQSTKSTNPTKKERLITGGKPNSKKKVDENTCPWVLLVSKVKKTESWEVRTYKSVHKCLQERDNLYATYQWFSKDIIEQLKTNPNIPGRAVQDQLSKKHELTVSESKAFRAKAAAEKKLRGDYKHQYKMLRDYVLELQHANPNTTVKIHVQSEPDHTLPTRVFKRIYICLGPLKSGFRAGMRELLGLDGAFMKGPYPGQLLTAVGIDPNNGIYPLAYGLVETENKESWTWFLTQLGDDLDLYSNSNFTFISDRQKGIIPAIETLFPSAEHRFCVKHIHDNMKLQWNGTAYKDMLWKAATATTVPEFQVAMEELKAFKKDAYDWLCKIPPQHWTRSHFSERAKSDVLLNNMCEVFNGKLVGGRDKPIIATLEFAREYLMRRIVNVNKLIARCDGPLTPTATRILKANAIEANKYTVQWNGGELYQVSGPWNDQCVVNAVARTCTCRRWELMGIPCKHAVATNWNMSLNHQDVGLPEDWVHPCYRLDTWKKVYSFHITPIRGPVHWPKCHVPTTLLPPTHQPQIGRPRKARKKSKFEKDISIVKDGKLSRKHKTVTCDKCGNKGHNQRSCTGPRVSKASKRKGVDLDSDNPATTATAQDKGKSVATQDGAKKKKAPGKKTIVLG